MGLQANSSIFFIPGFRDDGPLHWQSWLLARLPNSHRLQDVDWNHPDLNAWVDQANLQLNRLAGPVWLVAHSFGCFAAAVLAAERPAQLGGVLFVAPADPQRFAAHGGVRNTRNDCGPQPTPSVADILPLSLPLSVKSALLASENDPWLGFPQAQLMAEQWRSHFVNLGEAGHVNAESGHGAWPGLLRALDRLRRQPVPDFSSLQRAALEFGELEDDISRSFAFEPRRGSPPTPFSFAL